jgi:hypothetical protein
MSFNVFLALRTGSGHDNPLVSSSLSNFTRSSLVRQLDRHRRNPVRTSHYR